MANFKEEKKLLITRTRFIGSGKSSGPREKIMVLYLVKRLVTVNLLLKCAGAIFSNKVQAWLERNSWGLR